MTDDRKVVSQEQFETIKAILGVDAETMQRTKLGQYILDRGLTEEERLIEELIEVATGCGDAKLVKLAMEISMHRMFPRYLEEAIQAGRIAEQNLEAMEAAQDY